MDFNHFKKNLSKLREIPLGGLEAQFELAPKFRQKYTEEFLEATNAKKAAVLALFYPNTQGETCFLLTLRANYNGVHASQISFPGGKFDNFDNSLENTALREAQEEVGICPDDVYIFKQMTNVFIPPSNFMVTPFLGLLNYTPTLIKNEEVEENIDVLLKDLLNKSAFTTTVVSTSYAQNIPVPCFNLSNFMVWGATAMMLNEIKVLLKEI
ncbi:MAG: CoA pyrophosphatase [Lutibacter sp.]|nr:CoA pyrophosphatase [Lutibacter sp.]MDT8418144.1 CoA pyrophosphatase [Lutibacter sp.]